MKTPLAFYNLIHDRLRTLVAITGVTFAVVLVFLQLGSYGAVLRTATLIYSRLDYDVLICSREYLDFTRASKFPMARLDDARRVSGVARVSPFYISYLPWRNPATGRRRAILLMAFQPDDAVFTLPAIHQHDNDLKQPNTVLMDTMSRPEFGPQEVGVQSYLGRVTITVIGFFTMGTGFGADGAIVGSAATFGDIFPQRSLDEVNLGLVKLSQGADAEAVAARLRKTLPDDVVVLTRRQNEQREEHRWTKKTSVGVILSTGLGVALIVGIAIVYQVLASNILAHLSEYATLKAIGYTSASLAWMVVQQALILAGIGFFPGFLISIWLYDYIRRLAHIPISMTWMWALLVLAGSFVMCSLAAVLALRKVYSADPAELL